MSITDTIYARIAAVKASREARDLIVRWTDENGVEQWAYPATEEAKMRWIKNLRAKGLVVHD